VTEASTFVQQLPLQPVPSDVAAQVADLGFAGRYIPAGDGDEPIAGDFYDVLKLDSDLVALVVGDVSGHGTGALARMQELRAAARAYAVLEPDPVSVITRLDRFCERLESESLATLWYATYQPSTGALLYVSAGHPPPVLACHGEPVRLLQLASAPPLGTGVAPAHAVDVKEVLPPGAVLVAYSDGLVERPDQNLDDQLRLLQASVTLACDPARAGSATQIASEILASLVPDPQRAHDDVCLLVVRRQP
jgi:sigma-B regulation protein RsbU (phosphoserine phosphatase)